MRRSRRGRAGAVARLPSASLTAPANAKWVRRKGLDGRGLAADLIAVPGNPLEKIDALRDVQFVMKDGVVFKQKGVMTPGPFFHGGPEYGLVR